MQKKYVVRLTEEERSVLQQVVKKVKGSGQKVRRAQILLKADADGPQWTDQPIPEAFWGRPQPVEGSSQRAGEGGRRGGRGRGKREERVTGVGSDAGRMRERQEEKSCPSQGRRRRLERYKGGGRR